ncbi:hypothetical protein [Actinoplanes sp. NPDC049265]|uniref:hypothetical protein n=1 Tax=Actinoplanes sp. NPDC049265 TaxID=3363902 RepID=UPI003723BC25
MSDQQVSRAVETITGDRLEPQAKTLGGRLIRMEPRSASEHLEKICDFVTYDLGWLSAACDRGELPLAKFLHHVRRQTTGVRTTLALLEQPDDRLMYGCLLETFRACDAIAARRIQRHDWVLTMLPELAAALSSGPRVRDVRPARVRAR